MSNLISLLRTAHKFDLIERYKKFGNQHALPTFTRDYIVKLFAECDAVSSANKVSIDDKRMIITLLGLLWDNCSQNYPGIKKPIMIILARIGYLPNLAIFDRGSDNLSILESQGIQSNRILHSAKSNGDKRTFLTSFQQQVWANLEKHNRIAISAPTSAGKTFVIVKWIASKLIENSGCCLFIAPTLALCSQIAESFSDLSRGSFNVSTNVSNAPRKNFAYVLTQEKVSAHPEILNIADYVVIDEIQNVEKFGNDLPDRSLTLLDVIEDIVSIGFAKKIIVAGPMVIGINKLSETLFEKSFTVIEDSISPVASITYSFKNKKGLLIQSHLYNGEKQEMLLSSKVEKGIESKTFAASAQAFMGKIIATIPESEGVIIFSGSTYQASTIAKSLPGTPSFANDLWEYCAETVSEKYELTDYLRKGVAFHHSKIPTHIRRCIEIAFGSGDIRQVVATTTLLQGVNFPAKHIIIRNPRLGSKGESQKLSEYDISNLRGRAGRLFKDFVGRSYLLNEDEFQEDGELDLFPKKEVQPSMKDRFALNMPEIIAEIGDKSNEASTDPTLSALIASKVALYGDAGIASLYKLGIHLTREQIAKIKASVSSAKLDAEYHRRFKRIDHISLMRINELVKKGVSVPDITKPNFFENLVSFLETTSLSLPVFFERKLKIERSDIDHLSVLTSQWGRGTELALIVKQSKSDIGKLISLIQSTIVYDLAAYLSPFMYLQKNKNITIEAIESGTFHQGDNQHISAGVPREVAVRIRLNKAKSRWDKILIERSH